jgi:hypothetical protein
VQRLWQVRDAILARRRADHHRHTRLVETQTRWLVGAVHGAAGNRRAASAAAAVSFLSERRTVVPRLADITGRYGAPLAVIRGGKVIPVGH